jgi:cell division protein FtsW
MTGSRRRHEMDYTLLAVAVSLVCFGVVMIYSASAIWAEQNLGNSLYFFKRQLIWAVVSLGAMAAASRFNYNRYRE